MITNQPFSDDDLMELVKNDDLDAFTKLCERYRVLLYWAAHARLENKEEAEDIVQDIFIYVWESRKKINCGKSIKAYMLGAMKNLTADYLRKRKSRLKREQTYEEMKEEVAIEALLEKEELASALQLALEKMPAQCRYAIQGRFFDKRPLSEVAIDMNVNVQTVKNHINRAKKILRKQLLKINVP